MSTVGHSCMVASISLLIQQQPPPPFTHGTLLTVSRHSISRQEPVDTSSNMSDKTSPAGSTGGGLGVAVQGGKSKNKASPSRARSGSRGHSQSPSPRSRSHSKSRQVKLSTKFRKISQYSEGASYSPCWNESFYGHFHTFFFINYTFTNNNLLF